LVPGAWFSSLVLLVTGDRLTALAALSTVDGVSAKVRSDHDCSRWLFPWPTICSNDTSAINPMLRRRPSDCPHGKDEDASSDEASDQIAYPTTTERDTEHVE